MKLRLTAILAFIALILALLATFWERDDQTAHTRYDRARRAFRFDPARIHRLILYMDEQTIECQLIHEQWRLTRPIAARADAIAIERILGGLQELARSEIILPPSRSPDPYRPYGLDPPRARIELVENGYTNHIWIGRRTPLGNGVYVRHAEQAAIARSQADLLALLPATPDAVRERTLFAGAPSAIQRFEIRTPAGYVQLARGPDGLWRFFQPFTARADSVALGAIIETVLAGRIVQFVQDGVTDLASYGLDSQSAITVVLDAEDGNGTQMLALGDPLPNHPALIYARLQGESSIYAVSQNLRAALSIRPEDLRDRNLPGVMPASVRRLSVEDNGSRLEFARDTGGQWVMTAPWQAPADANMVESFLRAWAGVRLSAHAPAPDAPEPALTRSVLIETADDPGVILRLQAGPHPEQDHQMLVALDDDPTILAATPADILDLSLDPQLYRSLDILSVARDDILEIHLAAPALDLRFTRDRDSGDWSPPAPWLERLLSQLDPLQAQSIQIRNERPAMGLGKPHLALTLRLKGSSGLGVTLLVGNETKAGGPRWAKLRGRDLIFTLSANTLTNLLPPAPEPAE